MTTWPVPSYANIYLYKLRTASGKWPHCAFLVTFLDLYSAEHWNQPIMIHSPSISIRHHLYFCSHCSESWVFPLKRPWKNSTRNVRFFPVFNFLYPPIMCNMFTTCPCYPLILKCGKHFWTSWNFGCVVTAAEFSLNFINSCMEKPNNCIIHISTAS